MRKSLKIIALILSVTVLTAFAGGCVFGGTLSTYKIDYVLCDDQLSEAYFESGATRPESYSTSISLLELPSPVRDGYVFRGWYDNPEYAGVGFTKLRMDTRGDVTLYASWEASRPTGSGDDYTGETVDTWRGFLPYVEEFDEAYSKGLSGSVLVESRDELMAYCEYVQYKYIPEAVAPDVYVSYDYESSSITEEIRIIADTSYFSSYMGLSWSLAPKSNIAKIGIIYPERINTEATKTCSDSDYYTQIQPYNYESNGSSHELAIDSLAVEMNCETSNQLFYAAMTGAKPIPNSGSVAEEIYAEARTALSQSVNNGMEDYEKVRAIYDWLIMNVTYDYDVIEQGIALPEAIDYDAFYLEGVFGSGRAVCDGISKAMVLLCRMEGIPCVRVVGADHAWNKVYVGGKWYIADATFGDTGTSKDNIQYSFLTHRSFLVAESANEYYMSSENYLDTKYAATEDFGFYKYEYLDDVNLVVRNKEEFRKLYEKAKSLNYSGAYSVDFYVTDQSFVTMGMYSFDEDAPQYGTLFFNI